MVKGKSLTQPDGGEGCSGITTGFLATGPGRQWPRRGEVPQTHGATYRNRIRRAWLGRACNARRSPLSIKGQERISGARVGIDVSLPREARHVSRLSGTERPERGAHRVAGVSRGRISRWETSRTLPQGMRCPEDSPR